MSMENQSRKPFPLRISPSMRVQAKILASWEGVSLSHFISIAIEEKMARMRLGHKKIGAAKPSD
jgi:predicted HicB family RNase H-like nuclease